MFDYMLTFHRLKMGDEDRTCWNGTNVTKQPKGWHSCCNLRSAESGFIREAPPTQTQPAAETGSASPMWSHNKVWTEAIQTDHQMFPVHEQRRQVLGDVLLSGWPVNVSDDTLHHPLDAFVYSVPAAEKQAEPSEEAYRGFTNFF